MSNQVIDAKRKAKVLKNAKLRKGKCDLCGDIFNNLYNLKISKDEGVKYLCYNCKGKYPKKERLKMLPMRVICDKCENKFWRYGGNSNRLCDKCWNEAQVERNSKRKMRKMNSSNYHNLFVQGIQNKETRKEINACLGI